MRRTLISFVALAAGACPAFADCNAELAGIWQAFMKAGPYHVEMQMAGPGGQGRTIQGDVDLPDKFHMIMPQGEMVKIGDNIWMNMGGAWRQMPGAAGKMMQGQMMQGMAAGLKSHANVQCLGAQTYQGKAVSAYVFDSAGNFSGIKTKSHVQLFTDNGLPAFLVVDGEAMGHKSHTEQTITYDPSITIAPPK
jgi:hypothetical protein